MVIVRGFTFVCVLCLWVSCAQADFGPAREIFIGVDGDPRQLASAKATQSPAKPKRPKVLGLQTTIYQLSDDGGIKAVSPSTIFVGGSKIRLAFNANRAGYLYLVNLGSSGKVTTLFPTAVTDNNQVQPGLLYQIPQQTGKSIKFDATPGEEVIVVVLAESRITEFSYGGQRIIIRSPSNNSTTPIQAAGQQHVIMAALDVPSTSKDLFVEDDGVFQTVVFNPTSEASISKKPLVTTIKLVHR